MSFGDGGSPSFDELGPVLSREPVLPSIPRFAGLRANGRRDGRSWEPVEPPCKFRTMVDPLPLDPRYMVFHPDMMTRVEGVRTLNHFLRRGLGFSFSATAKTVLA